MKIKWNRDFKKVPINKICFIALYNEGDSTNIFGRTIDGAKPYIKTHIAQIKKLVTDDGDELFNFYSLNRSGSLTSYHMSCINFDHIPSFYYGFAKYNKKIAEAYMYLNYGKIFEFSQDDIWDGG